MDSGTLLIGLAALCALLFFVRGVRGGRTLKGTVYGPANLGNAGGNITQTATGAPPAEPKAAPKPSPWKDGIGLTLTAIGTAAAVFGAYLKYLEYIEHLGTP